LQLVLNHIVCAKGVHEAPLKENQKTKKRFSAFECAVQPADSSATCQTSARMHSGKTVAGCTKGDRISLAQPSKHHRNPKLLEPRQKSGLQ
jgi:hypothetical protein